MPRIYDSASNPLDFCKRCFPKSEKTALKYADEKKYGPGPDDRGNCFGYDAEHPDYDDTDYRCETCNRQLSSKDN